MTSLKAVQWSSTGSRGNRRIRYPARCLNMIPPKHETGASATKLRGSSDVEIQYHVGNCGIYGGQNGTGEDKRPCTVSSQPDHHSTYAPSSSEPQSSGAVSALDGHSAGFRLRKVNFKINFHCTTLVKRVQRSIRTAINYFLLYPLHTKSPLRLTLCLVPTLGYFSVLKGKVL